MEHATAMMCLAFALMCATQCHAKHIHKGLNNLLDAIVAESPAADAAENEQLTEQQTEEHSSDEAEAEDPSPSPTPTPDDGAPAWAQYAPGSRNMALGIDSVDGERSKLPIFHFTFDKFNAEKHEHEMEVPDAEGQWTSYMIPDQLYIAGPNSNCESSAHATTQVVETAEEMSSMESKQQSSGMSGKVTASYGAGPVSASAEVSASSESATSTEGKEYQASARIGSTRSAFSSVKTEAYTASFLTTSSLHPVFIRRVAQLKEAFAGDVTANYWAIAAFVNDFGTDYLDEAILGGRVSKQMSASSSEESTVSSQELKEASSSSMDASFKVEASYGAASGSVEGEMHQAEQSASEKSSSKKAKSASDVSSHSAKFEGGVPTPGASDREPLVSYH